MLSDEAFEAWIAGKHWIVGPRFEAAKDAWQAAYRAGLEEAAKVCEKESTRGQFSAVEWNKARDCAAAIRALGK